MSLLVFDDIARDLSGPSAPNETHFAYLNRSNRPEAARVRDLVEAWVSHYPQGGRASLVARLRSPIDHVHYSAFWELTLHEWLLRTGHNVLEIEPELPHTRRSPDFLVEAPGGVRFYLEAVVATGKSADEQGEEMRLNAALHAVDSVHAPGHFLELHIDGKPTQPVSLKTLRRKLGDWVQSLPEGEVAKDVEPFVYEEHGARFTVTAFPRNAPVGKPERAVGLRWMEPYWGTPGDGIREAIEKKSCRYGALGAPYVVAVDAMSDYQGEQDAIDALLGSPCVIVRQLPDGPTTYEESRSPNGVWLGARGARKRGLSAVLSTERLYPWSVSQRRARLIRNPWATSPLPAIPLCCDELNPVDGRMAKTDGLRLHEILGVPAEWPED